MRLHLVALPHTQTTSEYLSCAYTQKAVKFCRMMAPHHEVILYAGEQNEAPCAEHVPLVTEAQRRGWFGEGFDTVRTPLRWEPYVPYFQVANERAIREIRKRAEPRDLILLTTGWPQKPIADAFPEHLSVEWAVGYEGICLPHRAFESAAWMHHVYGLRGIRNGHFYDAVIPNFFDPSEFHLADKEDYVLFVGRLVARKGPHVALQVAERAGVKLLVAGPGATSWGKGEVIAPEVTLQGDVEYVGELGVEERASYMARARALLCPTLYVEPFGGVAVEAMLSGTPVIATDWGAFTETVTDLVGSRFRTLAEGAAAVRDWWESGDPIDHEAIRQHAIRRYSLDAVRPRFERWLGQLQGLWGEGWNA